MDYEDDTQRLWDIYYSGIVGWSLHPGYNRDNTKKLTLSECAEIVDKMIEERNKRCRG